MKSSPEQINFVSRGITVHYFCNISCKGNNKIFICNEITNHPPLLKSLRLNFFSHFGELQRVLLAKEIFSENI